MSKIKTKQPVARATKVSKQLAFVVLIVVRPVAVLAARHSCTRHGTAMWFSVLAMRNIRVLRDFTTTHALALERRIATEREPGKGYPQPKSIVVAKEAKFVAGEEVETMRLQGDGELRLVSSRLDGRQYAILDTLTEGKDFEFVG